MPASWDHMTSYLKTLNLPIGSRVALPVDHITRLVGEWPEKANTPTYWALDMSNPPARYAWQAGFLFGGFDFVTGSSDIARIHLERVR
jgi:hypothetical protein